MIESVSPRQSAAAQPHRRRLVISEGRHAHARRTRTEPRDRPPGSAHAGHARSSPARGEERAAEARLAMAAAARAGRPQRRIVMRSALADDALLVGARLVDAAYTAWLVAQAESANALRAWFEARTGLRSDANLAYRA